jgi:NMD protein affecting ribosome stability and mRNA decay
MIESTNKVEPQNDTSITDSSYYTSRQNSRTARLAAGLCSKCGKAPHRQELNTCQTCAEKERNQRRVLREKRERENLCVRCGSAMRKSNRLTCLVCAARIRERSLREKRKRERPSLKRVPGVKYLYYVEPAGYPVPKWRKPDAGFYVVNIHRGGHKANKHFSVNKSLFQNLSMMAEDW